MSPSATEEIVQIQVYFWTQLSEFGWRRSSSGDSESFRKGRNVIVVSYQPGDSLAWTAFPWLPFDKPVDPFVGYTRPQTVPVASFRIRSAPTQDHVVVVELSRADQPTEALFFTGPMQEAFERMLWASELQIRQYLAWRPATN